MIMATLFLLICCFFTRRDAEEWVSSEVINYIDLAKVLLQELSYEVVEVDI